MKLTSGVISYILLWLPISKVNALASLLRSPLCMTINRGNNNGNNKIDSSRADGRRRQLVRPASTSSSKTLLSSVSTSPSPLVPQIPVNPKSNGQIYRRKGRPAKVTKKTTAPMIDSTLLRFLSAQKSQIEAQEKTLNDVELGDINDSSSSFINSTLTPSFNDIGSDLETSSLSIMQISDTINGTELIQSMTDNLMKTNVDDNDRKAEESDYNADVITEASNRVISFNEVDEADEKIVTTTSQVSDTTADSISWFTQYNAHNVAKKLIKLGACEESAHEAGNSVQNYSLNRTTRQRVRKFLSDRDSVWASSSGQSKVEEQSSMVNNGPDFLTMTNERKFNVQRIIDVLTEAGLTGKDITAIFAHTPSVSMMQTKKDAVNIEDSLEATLERAYFGVLCSTIKLRKCDARKVLRTCPGLLTNRGSTSSEEVISILSNLGVAPKSLCRDKSALPILLSRSPASLFRFVAFLSSDAVRMPVNTIGPLFRRSECASLLDYVAPLSNKQAGDISSMSVNYLLSGSGANGEGSMGTEITRRYKSMFQTAKYLRRVVGVKDLGRTLSANANILTLGVEEEIKPCIKFLSEEVGMEEEEIPKVLETYPQLLGTSNITTMRENYKYLLSIEVAEEDLGRIFRAFPALLTLEISKMKRVVNFLKTIGVTNIGRFVTRLPPVLGYSVENDLIPKWNYLKSVRHYASFEIGRFPAYFSYPLDRVIRNRFDYLILIKQLPRQILPPTDEVLRFGNVEFATLVAKDDDVTVYKSFLEDRKKSNGNNKQQQKRKSSSQRKNRRKGNSIGDKG